MAGKPIPKVDPKTVPPSQFALSTEPSQAHIQLQTHPVSKIGLKAQVTVDPKNVPPSQFAISTEPSQAHQRLQSHILDPHKPPAGVPVVDPATLPPSQFALSVEPSEAHQRLQSHVVIAHQPPPGVPVVDPATVPASQFALSFEPSEAHQRLQSHVVIPSALLRAGESKFGEWKRRPVQAPSSGLVSASASRFDHRVCDCDPCLCSPPPGGFGIGKVECDCNPCLCTTPPGGYGDECAGEGEEEEEISLAPEPEPNYNLSNFLRAREFFMTKSTKTGVSLYEHFSELIRQMLDNKAPDNPVDFVEEMSLNLKRYRFGMNKDIMQDSFYLSTSMIEDAEGKITNWKQHALWSKESAEKEEKESTTSVNTFGGFPNMLRLQYYLEQVNVGLPREEMFKVALALRQIKLNNPVTRVRFWGKIFGIYGNYYIFEAEVPAGQELENTWSAATPESPPRGSRSKFNIEEASAEVPGPVDTLERAGKSVTDPEIFNAYVATPKSNPKTPTSAKSTASAAAPINPTEFPGEGQFPPVEVEPEDAEKWREYQDELMQGIPVAKLPEELEIPPEEPGKGVNRRVFFVLRERTFQAPKTKDITDPPDWLISTPEQSLMEDAPNADYDTPIALPPVTPQQINVSRQIRWYPTGDLNSKVMSCPKFPGLEGDYLHALLVRITAGTSVSPRGYYRTKKYGDEEEGEGEEEEEEEEVEEEEEDEGGSNKIVDIVYPNKKFRYPNLTGLISKDLELWVHHAAYILKQGRIEWINISKPKPKNDEELGEEEEEEEELGEEEEEEHVQGKEIGPKLFTPLTEDKNIDPVQPTPWSARASSSVFTEFQVAQVRSNLWPGANAICTHKWKVENIYLGDGLKFFGRTYAPFLPEEPEIEYKEGPELMEFEDPSVEEEQAWLAKLQLNEIGDIEDKFVDNEDEEEGEGEEEDEEDDDD